MNRKEAVKKATELVDQMTLEEMASQLRFDAPAIERLSVPEYNWWNECLHGMARNGTATVFPQAIGLGATFDQELMQEIGDCISTEVRAKYNESVKHGDRDIYKGLTVWSPNVNLFRDPRWGRGQETYGEDPVLISNMAVPFIKGLQGNGQHLKTAACAKHFAVHSGPEALRHHFDAKASMKDLWETYLPAFEACVKDAKVESVMGAYNRTNGEPCCAHGYLMQEVLRTKWNFQGHFVSDCWAIQDFHQNHKITDTPEKSAQLALEKGCDLNCGCTYQKILDACQEGLVPKENVRRAAIRLFTTRYLLGMSEKTEYDDIPYEEVDSRAHQALASRAARESIVLLKNNGILPFDRQKIHTIGVIGPNADSRRALIGNYHGTAAGYVTVLDGIENIAGDDIRVLYAQGSDKSKDRVESLARANDRISEAQTVAEHSDAVVLCLGLDELLEGEEGDAGNAYASGDKLDLRLPKPQEILLEKVLATGTPTVVCMMSGSAMDLQLADEKAAAVLQLWYPGGRGGLDAARILFGLEQPSGKLPVTFYRDLEDMPEFTDYTMQGRTYRFLGRTPLYPFGYGLGYGKTQVLEAEVTEKVQTLQEGQDLRISAEIVNRGQMPAEEVLQVYVHVDNAKNEVRNPKLAAFARITLQPGEQKKAELMIPEKAFRVINEAGEAVREGTGAHIYVGLGQPDERTRQLYGNETKELTVSF